MSDKGDFKYNSVINEKLNLFRKRLYLRNILQGSIITLGLFLSLTLIFSISEYFGKFGSGSRLFLLLSFGAILSYAFIKTILLNTLKYLGLSKVITNEEASKIIGDHFSEISDQLTNIIQLEKEEKNELLIASINQKALKVSPFEFRDAISFNEVFKFLKWSSIPLIIVALISVWDSNIISKGASRIVNFNKEFKEENPYQFEILNDNLTVVRNDNFDLEIAFNSESVPNDVHLIQGNKEYRFAKTAINKYSFQFRNIQSDIDFEIKTAGFSSNTYKLKMLEKPTISKFEISLNYPNYINKEDDLIQNNGDLVLPEGTEVTWNVFSNHSENLIFQTPDTTLHIPTNGNQSIISQKVFNSFSYSILPHSLNNVRGDKMNFQIKTIKDEYPVIKVKNHIDSINPLMIFHSGIISDDYGFKKLLFKYSNKDTAGSVSIPIPTKETFQHRFNHGISVQELGFEKGDEFTYFFEVFDNDGINGSKSARSLPVSYRIPSKEEVNELLAQNNESIKDQLNKNLEEAQNLQKEFQNIQKMLLQKKNMDWQDKSRLEQFLEQQRQFENKLEKLKFDQQKNEFQKDQLSPQEENILRKQEQINDLFDQLMDEETKKLYEELEKLLEEFDEEKTKEALEEINLSNEELEKELDRTLEMFKQIEFDEQLEDVINQLDELSKEQEKLAEETKENKEASEEELQNKQEEINEKFKDIQKDLKELEQKNEELENKRDLENTEDKQQEIKEEQEKSSDELQKGNKKKAGNNQKKAAQKMQELSKQMAQMQQEMQQQGQMEDMNSLRQILENLISLSVEQEELMQNIKSVNRFDPQFPNLATKQGDLKESAKIIEDSLLALSKRQIALENIINKEIIDIKYNMDKSIDLLRERKNYNAAVKQQYVMTSANNLALLLDESLEQMQNQMKSQMQGSGSCSKPGGSNPKGGISDIKKMQKELSEQMKKMMEEMKKGNQPGKKGKQGKNGLAKSLAQMSAQQNAIKEQLKKLGEQQKRPGKNVFVELYNLLKDLEKNENDILNKNITRETIMRQEKIMSKLLKAENAMRERELEEKRKSNKGKNDFSRNPKDFSPYKSFELKEMDGIKTIPSSFNLFYKRKISEYFNTFEE